MKPLPLAALTLYAELAQQVENASRDEATVFTASVKGIPYLRLQRWVGARRVIEHLGRADDPASAARAESARNEAERRNERRMLVAALKKIIPGPSAPLGKVLDAVSYAGLFRRGAVLVGTGAYQCFPPLVGAILPHSSTMTQDADLASADLALTSDLEGESMETILQRADPTFRGQLQLGRKGLPSRFRSRNNFAVELLTPERRRSDKNPMPLKNLAAGAIPLRHLDWLIEETADAIALHGAGVAVRVPAPQRYAVLKLIIAQKRPPGAGPKRMKDLVQAGALMKALEINNPHALSDCLADARKQGKMGWSLPIDRSLIEIDSIRRSAARSAG